MRTRHPFPDIEDTAPETVLLGAEIDAAAKRLGEQINESLRTPCARIAMHDGENRLTRRIAVAEFDMPVQPGLRRMLLKQRQRQRRGKMDVELNRLLRRKAKQHE